MNTLPRSAKVAAQALLSGVLVLAAAIVPAQAAKSSQSYPILVFQGGLQPLVRNFNPFAPWAAQPEMQALIYEPLYEIDNVQFREYPWLATSYTWSTDLTTLTFTIRHGVRWSDGTPFTAKDVYFTLWTLPHKCAACDQAGLLKKGGSNQATNVTMPAPDKVAIHFKTVDVTRLFTLVDFTWIIPEHIWSKHIKDALKWANPNPVGTGPFTKIKSFSMQSVDYGPNPYYWQKQKIQVSGMREEQFTSQDAANLALEAGQLDAGESGAVPPNCNKVYVARNPRYFHCFVYPGYSDNDVFLNDAKYPFSLVAFRKALSMDINRTALVRADFGYPAVADAQSIADITGKVGPYPQWVDRSVPQTLVQYNPNAARAMLKQAGFTWRNGKLIDPKGKPVTMSLIPTFYLAEADIMARDFRQLGIDVTIENLQFGTYYDKLQKGDFDAADGWTNGGPSPYVYYSYILDSSNYAPIGQSTPWAWERWKNPQMDKLFAEFHRTLDPRRRHELADQMQRLFVQYLPVIPTVTEYISMAYKTDNYTGWPTLRNPYAYGIYVEDTGLILTHLRRTQ